MPGFSPARPVRPSSSRIWPTYSHDLSRHDSTQLFACLVVREMLKLSYRKAEAMLRDANRAAGRAG